MARASVRVEFDLPNEFENNVTFRDDTETMTTADFESEISNPMDVPSPTARNASRDEVDQAQTSASAILNNLREEEEIFQLISINIYDCHAQSTVLRINRQIKTKEICRAIASRLDLNQDEMTMYTLVVVLSVYDSQKRNTIHCIRTLQNEEFVLPIVDVLIYKLMERFQIVDSGKIRNSIRWYYKDIRTNPIEFGDQGEVTGEYSSDEEDYISPNDFSYLYKAERKGYLLKRSSRDQNLWRKWYCILTDHLWCINTSSNSISSSKATATLTTAESNNTTSSSTTATTITGTTTTTNQHYGQNKAICIPLSGMVRYRSNTATGTGTGGGRSLGSMLTSAPPLDQIQSIIINSNKGTYLFRALTINEQKKWIEDLQQKAQFCTDNEVLTMAEVIMNDEEWSWCKKFEKHVLQELYDMEHIFELIMLPYRQQQQQQQQQPGKEKTLLPSDIPSSSSSSSAQRMKYSRNLSLPLHHTLQKTQPYLYTIFHFLEDILAYKETFRHDLLIPITQQQSIALHIFVKYLFPQLLLNQGVYQQYHAEQQQQQQQGSVGIGVSASCSRDFQDNALNNDVNTGEGEDSIMVGLSGKVSNLSSKSRKWNGINNDNFDCMCVKDETIQEIWQTVSKRVNIANYKLNEIINNINTTTNTTTNTNTKSTVRSNSPVPSRMVASAPNVNTSTNNPPASSTNNNTNNTTPISNNTINMLIQESGATFLPLTRAFSSAGSGGNNINTGNTNGDESGIVFPTTYFPNGHWTLPSNVIIQVFWLLFTKRVNLPDEDSTKADEDNNQGIATRATMAFGLSSSFLANPANNNSTNTPPPTPNSNNNTSFWSSWFNRSGSVSNSNLGATNISDVPRPNATNMKYEQQIEFVPNDPQIDVFDEIVAEIMNILRSYPVSSSSNE